MVVVLVAGVLAEPESKPWIGYGGYGSIGYGYGGLGGYGGYGVYGRKKRDAEAEALSVLDVLTMDATVLVGALQALNLDHYGRKKRDATAVAESKPWYGSYGGYGGYGGYGYGRKRRDAEPLSALDILTMDSTVLVKALQDLNLDHYGRK